MRSGVDRFELLDTHMRADAEGFELIVAGGRRGAAGGLARLLQGSLHCFPTIGRKSLNQANGP